MSTEEQNGQEIEQALIKLKDDLIDTVSLQSEANSNANVNDDLVKSFNNIESIICENRQIEEVDDKKREEEQVEVNEDEYDILNKNGRF